MALAGASLSREHARASTVVLIPLHDTFLDEKVRASSGIVVARIPPANTMPVIIEETNMAEQTHRTLADNAKTLSSDLEQVFQRHFGELRDQVLDELGKLTTSGAAFGGGAGMAALGTVLGGLAFVHLVHSATRLPLWLCYAGSSAAACAVEASLVAAGVQKASELDVVPEGTGRAVREAVLGSTR